MTQSGLRPQPNSVTLQQQNVKFLFLFMFYSYKVLRELKIMKEK